MTQGTEVADGGQQRARSPSDQNIGLALSGGGFRAMLFHLGVVRLLQDAGKLTSVSQIVSVSGGSILAAHLGLHWDKYTRSGQDFEAAAAELISLARSDVRGRIIRQWILSSLAVLPRALSLAAAALPRHPNWLRWTLPSTQLQRCYEAAYRNQTMGSLQKGPDVHLLSTSMTTGACWSFSRTGVAWHSADATSHIKTTTIPISYAVSASSAFPPLFPPIEVDNNVLSCSEREFPIPQYLTDGGVFDNLGIDRLHSLASKGAPLGHSIISDAELSCDWAVDKSFRSIIGRNVRASDMLMQRVSALQYAMYRSVVRVRIGTEVFNDDDPTVADAGTQRALQTIRTDLDQFSADEVASLIYHGYAVARDSLFSAGLLAERGMPRCTWTPCSELPRLEASRWSDRDRRRAQVRRWRLFSRDFVTGLNAILVLAWVGLIASPYLVQDAKLRVLDYQAQQLANATAAGGVGVGRPNAGTHNSALSSRYVSKKYGNQAVIVFVHGVFGDAIGTWTCSTTGTYWPSLLADDPEFENFDVYVISLGERATVMSSGSTLDEIARRVAFTIRDSDVDKYQQLVFVVQDAGAVIVRSLLLEQRDLMSKTKVIVSFGEVEIGSAVSVVSSNKLLSSISAGGLGDAVNREWLGIPSRPRTVCAKAARSPIGLGFGSPFKSRDDTCSSPPLTLDEDHSTLVKPCTKEDPSYRLLRAAVRS